MAITKPIKSKATVKKAIKWLSGNSDEAFSLMYRLLCNTGLRVTDATEIRYSDINFDDLTITICENKGTKGNRSRAKLRVLERWHKTLYQITKDEALKEALFLRKPKDLFGREAKTVTKNGHKSHLEALENIVPAEYEAVIRSEMETAAAQANAKVRVVDIPKELATALRIRQDKYKAVDEGFVFSKRTMKSNRARGWQSDDSSKLPVITRQSVHKAFTAMQNALSKVGEKIEACAHGLRKTYARRLYETSGKDLNLVLQLMGWSDVSMVMRYLGFDEEQRRSANMAAQTDWV